MSSYKAQGPSQATAWALQRKEAVEKAKKLRDERKYNIAMTGEMTINSYNTKDRNTDSRNATTKITKPNLAADYSNNNRNIYGENYKKASTLTTIPVNEDDHEIAQSSLKLLKSKMKNYGGLSNTQNFDQIDSLTENMKDFDRDVPLRDNYNRGVTSKYQQSALSETTNPNNQNYRKQFKPAFDDDASGYGNGPKGLSKTGPQVPYGRQDNIRNENYRKDFDTAQENDYTGFSSQNVPSRIPKGTMGANKGKKENQEQNPYNYGYDDYSPINEDRAPSKQQPQAKQQKVYNPANYSANQPNKGYSKDPLEMPGNKGPSSYQSRTRPAYQEREAEDNIQSYSKPNPQKGATNNPSRNSLRQQQRTPLGDERTIKNAGSAQYEMDQEEYPSGSEPLIQCPEGCGRKFFASVIEKHAKACVKVFQSKRKKFDMAGQRMTEDQAKVATEPKGNSKFNKTKKMEAPVGKKQGVIGNKGAKWKQESELFRANLKAARGQQLTKEEAITVSKQQDSLTPCDYCGRRFNEEAAKRHIPFCQNKTKMDSMKRGPQKGKPTRKF